MDDLALLLGVKSFKPLEGESIENLWFKGSLDAAGVDIEVMEVAEDLRRPIIDMESLLVLRCALDVVGAVTDD